MSLNADESPAASASLMRVSAPADDQGPARPDRGDFSSLRLELTILAMGLVMVMSGCVGLTVSWIYNQALAVSQVEAGLNFARGAALTLSVTEDWTEFPWPVLGRSAAQARLNLALVSDVRGRVIYRGQAAAGQKDQIVLRSALVYGQPQADFDSEGFSVAVPVYRNNLVAGAVCLSGVPDELWATEDQARFWLLLALGANIILMGLFLIFFLNRHLMRPLKELARDLADLGHDRFQPRLRPRASREMAGLFRAFDRTALELMDSRRLLEEQLRTITETRDHLVLSEKMATVGRLASGLAHELGNPIGALMGFVHLLRRPDLDPEARRQILDQSAQELTRMDRNIKELLHFSRPGERRLEPVDATEVVTAAIGLARPQKWGEGVRFSVETEPGRPIMLLAERNGLLQVLLNLLANAGQALSEAPPAEGPGEVVVVIHPPGADRRVRLEVIDNGPGVAPEDVPHLFEPYFSRKSPGQGTGLGLAVSLSIIDDFGGRLQYAPAEGGGAVFTIILSAA